LLALALASCAAFACTTKSASDTGQDPTDTIGTPPPKASGTTTEAAPEASADTADAGTADAAVERSVTELAMDPTVELPEAVRTSLAAIENDPEPESLVRDSHYWVSNENFHHVFRKHIDDHGGVFAGVGTDQNYLMAAWARSPIILMIDFDEQIRNVHDIYGVILRRVDTPDALRKAWRQPDQVAEWIDADFEDDRARALRKTYSNARGIIYARLRKVAKAYTEREIPTFLTDQTQFEFIRDLWRNERVFAFRGDLTGPKTMIQIGRALREHGLSMGLFYTSNAEQYFPFTPEYRRNILALPASDASMVLRTRPYRGLGLPMDPEPELEEREQKKRDKMLEEMTEEEREEFLAKEVADRTGEYHYNVQRLSNMQTWLKTSDVEDVLYLLRKRRTNDDEVDGLSTISAEPLPSKSPPEIAPVAATQ
jgi:hypothetical protein